MKIEQFYDKGLAHASYAILNQGKVAVIDPGRDPQPYYDFAKANQAQIEAIIETHPHADFVSSHLEIAQATGGTIYASTLLGAGYPHEGFDEGDQIALGDVTLISMNTPGHSPDSISILLRDSSGTDHAVFTGDTLFIGDVGRPDLRENAGNITAQREELARDMYHSTREKLMKLPESVLVYPAHGAGSLCGKNLSSDTVSTIGRELRENYALQEMTEDQFVDILLEGQPFIPKYFGYNVDLNKQGASAFESSIAAVPRIAKDTRMEPGSLVIDSRPEAIFKQGHLPGAINLQDGGKFETWLGSLVGPEETFYLIAADEATRESLIRKAAKIGYESQIKGAMLVPSQMKTKTTPFDAEAFGSNRNAYTIVDIRNLTEYAQGPFFPNSLNIPLPELRERTSEIPTDKPVVVHCAGGYRSSAGSSIIESALGNTVVYDMSEAVHELKTATEMA